MALLFLYIITPHSGPPFKLYGTPWEKGTGTKPPDHARLRKFGAPVHSLISGEGKFGKRAAQGIYPRPSIHST